MRRGYWCGLFFRRNKLGRLRTERTVLLHNRLGNWRYVVIEEEVVSASSLGERI